jgi:hypothetical protein
MGATSNPIAQAGFSSATYGYLPLLSDGDDIVSRSATAASGLGVLKRGQILHVDPPTGALTLPVAATDCNCVLSNDVDATSAAVTAVVYLSGKMKADAIIWPALGHAAVTDALRNYTILIESVVFTDGTLVRSVPTEAEENEARKNIEDHRRMRDEAARTAAEPLKTADGRPLAPSDSSWAHLTAAEREKEPELAGPAVAALHHERDTDRDLIRDNPAYRDPLLGQVGGDPAYRDPLIRAGAPNTPPDSHADLDPHAPHADPHAHAEPHKHAPEPPEPHTQHTRTEHKKDK